MLIFRIGKTHEAFGEGFAGFVLALLHVGFEPPDGQKGLDFGDPVSYTISVTNNGPGDAIDASVIDMIGPDLVGAIWSCNPSGGATCSPSGVGNIMDTVTIPDGDTVTYTLDATIASSTSPVIENTAQVVLATNVIDPVPANNSATDLTLPELLFSSGFEN